MITCATPCGACVMPLSTTDQEEPPILDRFIGRSYAVCIAQAEANRWTFKPLRIAICPSVRSYVLTRHITPTHHKEAPNDLIMNTSSRR